MAVFPKVAWACLLVLSLCSSCTSCRETLELIAGGDSRQLSERKPEGSQGPPALLLIALDGVERRMLYRLLDDGELPGLAKLLGGRGDGSYPHAYRHDGFLSTLPSTTLAAWATALTGVPPAEHGMMGNEFFIREERRFAAPVPVSFSDHSVVVSNYTEGYANKLLEAPTVYQRLAELDPQARMWVAMHPLYKGADRSLVADRSVLAGAFKAFLSQQAQKVPEEVTPREMYAELDEEVFQTVAEELKKRPAPDVLTIYLVGIDSYAHVAKQGPDPARIGYLKEVLDPQLGRLHEVLKALGELEDRYVIVTADHGHTQVAHDARHALAGSEKGDPPELLKKAGFRVRARQLEVAPDADFQAVLAYQGAMAYVYVADRSTCGKEGLPCDWKRPPRYEEDVLAAAEAFHRNNRTGELVPEMKGALEMILVRKPVPHAEKDRPFQVYAGNGNLEPLSKHADGYPAFEQRLRHLAVGPHGERAGDILLLAHNGREKEASERFYFSSIYHSWHGSPSARDSQIPLIVAHPKRTRVAIGKRVEDGLDGKPWQQGLTDVMLELRCPGGSCPPPGPRR